MASNSSYLPTSLHPEELWVARGVSPGACCVLITELAEGAKEPFPECGDRTGTNALVEARLLVVVRHAAGA